jgi:hypothetical protein
MNGVLALSVFIAGTINLIVGIAWNSPWNYFAAGFCAMGVIAILLK